MLSLQGTSKKILREPLAWLLVRFLPSAPFEREQLCSEYAIMTVSAREISNFPREKLF